MMQYNMYSNLSFRYLFLGVVMTTLLSPLRAQESPTALSNDLIPYTIKGRKNPLSKNLSFANYSTAKVRRQLATFGSFGTINPFNDVWKIESIPLQKSERYRDRDFFSFSLHKNRQLILSVFVKATLKVREQFNLLGKQDSSYWGSNNRDTLIAQIKPAQDSVPTWVLVLTNLNISNQQQPEGRLYNRTDTIHCKAMNLLMRENTDRIPTSVGFSLLEPVYAFYYHDQLIAAVSSKERNRRFWIKPNLSEKISHGIAAATAILCIRRDLYQ